MHYHPMSTERFADLSGNQVCEPQKKTARDKNGDAIVVDDGKAGSSESTSASGSKRPGALLEHANTTGSYRLHTGRQISEALSLTDDEASVSSPDDDSEDSTSRNSAAPVDDLYSKKVRPRKHEGRYTDEIRRALVERAADVGFTIKSKSRVLWKQLPRHCAKYGVYIDNYPNGVVSPFGNARTARKRTGGIKVLTHDERRALLDALMSEKTHPMQFVSEKRPSDISNNRQPVIVYAPPPSDSAHKKSKRIFVDGSFDFQGHPQTPDSGKTARKRGLEKPSTHKPEKRRRLDRGIQSRQPAQPAPPAVPVRALAPVHPTTGTAETLSSNEISDDFLRTMEGRLFNYVFTYAERAMQDRDTRLTRARK